MKNLEIERKFLVKSSHFRDESISSSVIRQGYLASDENGSVRVRVGGSRGFITAKGATNESGTTRFEWEKEISLEEASNLIDLCKKGIVDKVRHCVPVGNHIFEVDEFMGDNLGLIVAEVELLEENEEFIKPDWLGEEVTGKSEYYNSSLSVRPFKNWQ